MRDRLGVGLFCAMTGLGLAMIAVYSSCGGTGGGTSKSQAAAQAVNPSCSPAGPNQAGGNCLTLAAPDRVPADGATIAGFRASLVNGSGIPVPGVQICFRFEDAGVAKIIEPTDGCGLTDSNGSVSGQFQAGAQDGSFQLIAEAPPGFNLEARKTISFLKTTRGVPPGLACSTGGDCASGECSSSTSICPSGPCCLAAVGDPCTSSPSNCASGLICLNGSCAVPPTPAPLPNGTDCNTSSLCQSACCGSSSGKCTSPASCVEPACSCI